LDSGRKGGCHSGGKDTTGGGHVSCIGTTEGADGKGCFSGADPNLLKKKSRRSGPKKWLVIKGVFTNQRIGRVFRKCRCSINRAERKQMRENRKQENHGGRDKLFSNSLKPERFLMFEGKGEDTQGLERRTI